MCIQQILWPRRDVLHALWSTNGSVVRLMKFYQHWHGCVPLSLSPCVCVCCILDMVYNIFSFIWFSWAYACKRVCAHARARDQTSAHKCARVFTRFLHLSLAQVAQSRVYLRCTYVTFCYCCCYCCCCSIHSIWSRSNCDASIFLWNWDFKPFIPNMPKYTILTRTHNLLNSTLLYILIQQLLFPRIQLYIESILIVWTAYGVQQLR